jgi:hypothetical protein
MRLNVDVAQLTSITPSYRTFRIAKRSGAPRHRGPRRCAQAHAALAPAARSITAKSAPVSAGFCTRAFDRAASQHSHWKGCRGEARHHEFLSQHLLGCMLSGFGPHRSRSGRRLNTLCRRPDVLFCARGARHGSHLTRGASAIVRDEGYVLHRKKKTYILRAHQRQTVAGLVVNATVNLPRPTWRWLWAAEHRSRQGRHTTISDAQLAGWRGFLNMVHTQRTSLAHLNDR